MRRAAVLLWPGLLCSCTSSNPFESLPQPKPAANDSTSAQIGDLTVAAGLHGPPNEATLWLRETARVLRAGEVIRSGIPIPRSWDIKDPEELEVIDREGRVVSSQMRVLARWNAGPTDLRAPVEWLLLSTAAQVGPRETSSLRLRRKVSEGETSSPEEGPLRLERQGDDRIIVDTGAARFTLGGRVDALFDQVLAGGKTVIRGGKIRVEVAGRSAKPKRLRRLEIEELGPWSAAVIVESELDAPKIGGGGLGLLVRYEFRANSPVALVRLALSWEGDICQAAGYDVRGGYVLTCKGRDGKPMVNGVRVDKVRISFDHAMGSKLQALLVGNVAQAPLEGELPVGREAFVRQLRRKSSDAKPKLELQLGDQKAGGDKATGGFLRAHGNGASVAVALDHMHRYEPQALRVDKNGRLAIDVVDEPVWLGSRQGLFARFAVGVYSGAPNRAELDQTLWAPLNHPLRAWPDATWFTASRAVDEVPYGRLPKELAAYDDQVTAVLKATLSGIEDHGLYGLTEFGLYPRYWGNPNQRDEIGCGPDQDPTPNVAWDNSYWCTAWADYHNASASIVAWAMRSGQVEWLDELAQPAALRVLHTQIFQCSPEDEFFYCGQSPAGYGGYRLDFNSSHAYFDNLILHYWLTGDRVILDTLERGARSMRNYLCDKRRGGGPACGPNDRVSDEWAELTGRVATQWSTTFRLLGLARDPSYLEDWRGNLGRAATQYYVEGVWKDKRYGFWMPPQNSVWDQRPDASDQLWMASLYDMNNLYRLMVETEDTPIGDPAIRPSEILVAWANTLNEFGAHEPGTGGARGTWPNTLRFEWTPPRIGGLLRKVEAETNTPDPTLYDTGKACLVTTLLRGAQLAQDPALAALAWDLVQVSLQGARAEIGPLGKIQGLYLARMHAAIARLNVARIDRETKANVVQ